jgi:hypothetical protein
MLFGHSTPFEIKPGFSRAQLKKVISSLGFRPSRQEHDEEVYMRTHKTRVSRMQIIVIDEISISRNSVPESYGLGSRVGIHDIGRLYRGPDDSQLKRCEKSQLRRLTEELAPYISVVENN